MPAAFQRHFGRVILAAGFNGNEVTKTPDGKKLRPWVQDYMRHTAISMYLARHKHEGEAATWAGNSPNVIHRHYKGLVKEADGNEFWMLTPATVLAEVVKFPPVGAKGKRARQRPKGDKGPHGQVPLASGQAA